MAKKLEMGDLPAVPGSPSLGIGLQVHAAGSNYVYFGGGSGPPGLTTKKPKKGAHLDCR